MIFKGGKLWKRPGSFEHTFVQYKRLVITWHVEKRAVTFYVILRSMLEQGPSFYPVLLHESCTVLNPSFWQRGLCREQWSCGGTGVGDTAQFWLTVSQYVEWGSMRCELLVLFFLLLRWFLRCLFFLLLWRRERKKSSSQSTPTRKMPFKCHQHIATMAACDSCLSVTGSRVPTCGGV